MDISFLPLDSEQRGGVEAAWAGRPVAIAGDPALSEGRKMGQNREDGKGVRFPCLPWVVMACRGGSAVAGREGWCRLWAAALGSSRGRGRWLRRCESERGTSLALL
jgi:hypothetical protein